MLASCGEVPQGISSATSKTNSVLLTLSGDDKPKDDAAQDKSKKPVIFIACTPVYILAPYSSNICSLTVPRGLFPPHFFALVTTQSLSRFFMLSAQLKCTFY
jgi:hypothetical protein